MVHSVVKEVSLYVNGNCNLPGNAVKELKCTNFRWLWDVWCQTPDTEPVYRKWVEPWVPLVLVIDTSLPCLPLVLCFLRCMLVLKNCLSIDSGCHNYQVCTVWGTCVGRRNISSIEHTVVCSGEEQHVMQCMSSIRHWQAEETGERCAYNAVCVGMSVEHIIQGVFCMRYKLRMKKQFSNRHQ